MNIFFRTNFNNKIGIGHLVRCNRLAQEFSKRGNKCYFFFDKFNHQYPINFKSYSLYNKKVNLNENQDAKKFCKLTEKIGFGHVVVDDYRLGLKWEKIVSKNHKKIITFDDLNNKEHFADFLINYNPINFPHIKYNFKLNKKSKSNFLIHPKYNILSKEKIKKNFIFKKNNFYVTFYIGGGGDLKILYKIILNLVKNNNTPTHVKFIVILGPVAKNKKKIINLSTKYKSVKIYNNQMNLYYVIKNSNIFFGTSGTATFETAFLKTSSILFKASANQNTNIFALENLGHYLFLDYKHVKLNKKICDLLISIINNYSRFKLLSYKPKIEIDDKGSSRIVDKIFSKQLNKIVEFKNNKRSFIQKGLKIKKVSDTDINHYLFCRNLNINRKMSSINKVITRLDHYIWWFNTTRESYVLTENGKKILYFYDEEIYAFNKKKYLLSGWFACEKDCSIRHILYALNWQKNLKKNVFWISFVKKNNLLANKYSKYVGWKIFYNKQKILSILKKKFNLNLDKFYFYIREN